MLIPILNCNYLSVSYTHLDVYKRQDLLGMIHYNVEVMDADRQGKSPYDFSETVTAEIRKIKEKIDNENSL